MKRPMDERGVALVASLLVMMLMSGLIAGVLTMVNADQAAGGIERDQTQAYAAAHAGVEKLTSDLGMLFGGNFSPTGAQLSNLTTPPREPALPGVRYLRPNNTSGYRITFNDTNGDGNPDVADPNGTPIASGPYQGLIGLITPYQIEVTARTTGNAEVRMRRTMQTIAVPVFQFGVFSESDLGFHAGDDFSFGGRVHTNRHLFLAGGSGTTLTLADRVTAVGEVVRTHFTNGRTTSGAGYTGIIRMARAPGCPAAPTKANSACRNLGTSEGSVTGNIGSPPNNSWVNLSVGTYNSYIRNGLTGGRRLDLPLVADNAAPIDLIRRPPAAGDPPTLAAQRFYNMASLRILLSDTAAEITALPGVIGTPISLEALTLPAGAGLQPLASSAGVATLGYRSLAGTPLIGGFILINKQATDGTWSDVTLEILNLGITGKNLSAGSVNINTVGTCNEPRPDAIVRLQRIKDVPASSLAIPAPQYCNMPTLGTDLWPNVLYDAREGLRRDNEATNQNEMYMGGLMHYIEFDVNNFRRWIQGLIGASGPNSMNVTGYVVYFSDRRTNKDAANQETGEYGWEDFINTDSVSTPNNSLDVGEDMNGNGTLETYGNTPQINYTVVPPAGGGFGSGSAINAASNVYSTRVNRAVARANRAVFFRRALKLVNGGLGAMPSVGLQGLTVVSENPVYVQGNYNACGVSTANCAANGFGPTGDAHRSAAIIADSVTLLSRSWNDVYSFTAPHNPDGRRANTTWYRMAVISGKGVNFPYPNNNAGDPANFGSDGGVHNFLRFLESWTANNPTIFYRGSLVSLFYSRQAVGTWKCCQNPYYPPNRGTAFDVEFLNPNLLPPRTPMFRDLNTLTFRQVLRPTQ